MGDTLTKRVEDKILASLLNAADPLDMDGLIAKVRATDQGTRAVDVKIAFLHDHVDFLAVLQNTDIVQRIAIDGDDIG